MRIGIPPIAVYVLVALLAYLVGYYAGTVGYGEKHLNPMFEKVKEAAGNLPFVGKSDPTPTTYLGAPATVPILAPAPSQVAPVPLVTLAAADEYGTGAYAPY